jgi:hypothetical protein
MIDETHEEKFKKQFPTISNPDLDWIIIPYGNGNGNIKIEFDDMITYCIEKQIAKEIVTKEFGKCKCGYCDFCVIRDEIIKKIG